MKKRLLLLLFCSFVTNAGASQNPVEQWRLRSSAPLSALEFVLTFTEREIEFSLGLSPPSDWFVEAKTNGVISDVVPLESRGAWQRLSWDPVIIGYFTDDPSRLFEISTTDENCVTQRGISVGSTYDDVTSAYGDLLQKAPGRQDENALAVLSYDPIHGYASTLYLLEFFFIDGVVTKIMLRIPV